jgi:hypothetical protein
MIALTVSYVRRLAGIPQNITDEALEPHIESAVKFVEGFLSGAPPGNPQDAERAAYSAACFAVAYALPVLNTFYLSNAERVPRQIAETDYVFHEPGELLKLVAYWEKRGYEALRGIGRAGGNVGVTVI